ncbi:hypothetical protein AAC387_Pa02g0965 [Persea americana]
MSGRGGSNGSGTQACAACKYQRRKCTPDCVLAPYFPPEKQRQFRNAHRLFGVSNIVKMIDNISPDQKADAMRSIIFEADMRANDPVGGCSRIISNLEREKERTLAELQFVLHQLALCREQQQQQMHVAATATATNVHHMQLGLNVSSEIGVNDYNSMEEQMQQNHFLYRQDLAPWMDLQQQNNNMIMENGCMDSSSTQILDGESDEMKPLVEMFDRKPAFVDTNESFPCSSRVGLQEDNDSLEQVREHDLKGAASFFTLKNSNTSSV